MSFSNSIPFEPPDRFLTELLAGSLRRIGTTIRDAQTGRMVGHLQETRLLPELMQKCLPTAGGGPAGFILQAGQLVSSIGANIQLEQVKTMLLALKLMTGATLAASVAGIGVSAAGFALVLRRLGQLEHNLAGVQREVVAARLVAERIDIRIATHDWARIESLLTRGDEAWVRSDADKVWKDLEGPLDQEQHYWRGLVGGQVAPSIFLDPHFTLEQAAAAYESALTLAATRIQTLLLLEQHAAARHHAREFHQWHDRSLSTLRPVAIASARSRQVAEDDGISEQDARSKLLQQSSEIIDSVREIELHVAERPAVIQNLMERGIKGRAYVEALRDCTEVPVLILTMPEHSDQQSSKGSAVA